MREAGVVIEAYAESRHEAVARLLAEAYCANPTEVAVFGESEADRLRQMQALFAATMPALFPGTKLVAMRDGAVLGFIHWVDYPGCRPDAEVMSAVVPQLMSALAEDAIPRLMTWRQVWGAYDPEQPHCHLGPFAVLSSAQGTGIGRELIRRYCSHLDETGAVGYLETDRTQNVRFYERSGFEVTAETEVLGAPSWFMTRRL